jgi:hypothetical protein
MIDTGRIVTGFFAYLNFTRLTSPDAIAVAIARGVSDGKMGYTAVWQFDGNQFNFSNKELIYSISGLIPRGLPRLVVC